MTDEHNSKPEQLTPSSEPTTVNNGVHGGQQNGQQQDDREEKEWQRKRFAEERENGRKKFLAELGFDDPDELKTLIGQAKQLQEAAMTESDKAKKALEKAQAEAAQLKAERDQIANARIQDKVDAAIRTAAITARAEHPDDVIELLRKLQPDDVAKVLDADGKVDETAVKKLIEAARKARPNYFAPSGPGSPSNRNGQNPEPNGDLKKEAKPELRNQYRRMT